MGPAQTVTASTAIYCRKSEIRLCSPDEQSCASTAGSPPADAAATAKGREKFPSAKIQRNPLKRLDSDERIQGNPSFSNPQKLGFLRTKGHEPRKPKRVDPP
jgi:hypothetical protein